MNPQILAITIVKNLSDVEENIPVTTTRLAGASVLFGLEDIWKMWGIDKKVDFYQFCGKEMWDDESTSGDQELIGLKETEALSNWNGEPFVPGFKAAIVQIAIMHVACAFAIQAMKAEVNSTAAWLHACEAKQWLGILQGTISGRGMQKNIAATTFSSRGLDKRHAENRAMKANVLAWCDQNIEKYKSLDKAAEAIAGKEVPVSFRTVRAWIGEWKKLRATGRL